MTRKTRQPTGIRFDSVPRHQGTDAAREAGARNPNLSNAIRRAEDRYNDPIEVRLELARAELRAGRRVHAKFHAVGALVALGHEYQGARKLSADLAIERAEARLAKRAREGK